MTDQSSFGPLRITASTAVSALGVGAAAHRDALRARRGGLRPNDFEAGTGGWIGRVEGVETHSLPSALAAFDCRNNRLADMALHADGFLNAALVAREQYGADRVAVVLGTSTSGVQAGEDAYRARDPATGALPADFDHGGTQDMFSLGRFVRAALGLRGPALVVSTACASSARSFADAAHLITAGVCDAAVVGGSDSLCRMTLQGFASLELISPDPCRPCDAARAGISVGEAAGFALLERAGAPRRGDWPLMQLLGWGATSDAHHMSAPHPQGAGAIGAMRTALRRAGIAPGEVDWINLHGTGTRANDAMEDLAVAEVFGDAVPCSSTKGWTGHMLGACGIVEAVIAGQCMAEGFVAGCLSVDTPDPAFRAHVAVANVARPVRRVVSNSFGFGGVNCSLVLGTEE